MQLLDKHGLLPLRSFVRSRPNPSPNLTLGLTLALTLTLGLTLALTLLPPRSFVRIHLDRI